MANQPSATIEVKTMGWNGVTTFSTVILLTFGTIHKEITSLHSTRATLEDKEHNAINQAMVATIALQQVGIHCDLINHCALVSL